MKWTLFVTVEVGGRQKQDPGNSEALGGLNIFQNELSSNNVSLMRRVPMLHIDRKTGALRVRFIWLASAQMPDCSACV